MESAMESELFEEIRKYTQSMVKPSRYEHSMRTALMLAQLCKNYGLSEDKGMLAGIAHDMCKDFSNQELFDLVKKDGREVSPLEKEIPALLHGRAAAVLIQEKFGVSDKEIIDAIANHTFGSASSCDFALLLFAADKIEPGRPQSTQEYRDNLMTLSLHGLVKAVLKENFDYLEAHGKSVAPESLELYKKLESERN